MKRTYFLRVSSKRSYRSSSVQFSSVTQLCLTLCDPMNRSTAGRPPYASPTSGVHSDSRPSSQWCHPAISSSVVPFSSWPQSLPASGSFQMSQFITWGGQSIGVSSSASVLPMNTQDWPPLGWTGWISLQSKGLSRVFSNTTVHLLAKIKCSVCSYQSYWVVYDYLDFYLIKSDFIIFIFFPLKFSLPPVVIIIHLVALSQKY